MAGDTGATASSIDRWQIALVALCLVGLVVAAFVAPVTPDAGGGDGGDGGGGGDDGGGDGEDGRDGEQGESGRGDGQRGENQRREDRQRRDGDGEPVSGDERITVGEGTYTVTDGDGSIPVRDEEGEPTAEGCIVVVEEEPVPGANVTVQVWNDREPATDVRVWFGDRYVGRTDPLGHVTGRVPYTRELNVTVELPGTECTFFRQPYDVDGEREGDGDLGSDLGFGADRPSASTDRSGTGSALSTSDFTGNVVRNQVVNDSANHTAAYTVNGAATVAVRGEPYPGETVTVVAAVEGVPMRHADVRVDGERVGQTAANGTYRLTVPDAKTATVSVRRGDFGASATVDVWLLEAAIVPKEGLPVPGERASVEATVGGQPRAGAQVSLDGSEIGTTGAIGTVAMRLPADPGQTVTVRTERQTTTVPLWTAYLSTIVASAGLFLVGLVSTGVTARARGRSAARRVAVWWVGVAVVFVGFVIAELLGLLAGLGVVLLAAAVVHREKVRSGADSTAGGLWALGAFVRGVVLAAADWLASALDAMWALLGGLAARLTGLPRSVSGLASRLWGWLRGLPGRVRTVAGRRLTARRAVAVALSVAFVAVLTDRHDRQGLVAGVATVSVAGLVLWWWSRDGETTGSGDTDSSTVAGRLTGSTTPDDSRYKRSVRAIWRQFARWVLPGSWRQSTPGEVSRAAVRRGFPERPVRVLTRAFREAEYGDRSLSSDRAEEAREAFESLERDREDERS